MLFIYVAGPYTSDPEGNTVAAIRVANELRDKGFIPFVPHLFHYWERVTPRSYADWMEMDLAWLSKCCALLRLPGESSGADREVAYAEQRGMPVFHDVETLLANQYNIR